MSTPAIFQAPLAADFAGRQGLHVYDATDTATVAIEGVASSKFVRRPMRGIVVKKDTYASITVVTAGGAAGLSLRNSSHPPGTPPNYTSNFVLQSVTETRNEKAQFVTTFGATYAFFFGEQPRIINCSAILPNTADFEWSKEWWLNYEERLRGTSLASTNTKVRLQYDEQVVTGYLTNCTTIQTSMEPNSLQVNFSLFVESITRGGGSRESDARAYRRSGTSDYLGVGALDDVQDTALLADSSTAAVRKTNIKLSPLSAGAPGAMSKFLSALNEIDAAMDNGVRKIRNALYGRNLVVPVSFTSSRASRAIFASGSASEDLAGLEVTNFFGASLLAFSDGTPRPGQNSVTLRTNTDGFLALDAARKVQNDAAFNFQNFDEYVNYPPATYVSEIGDQAIRESELRELGSEEAFYSNRGIAAFQAFGINVAPFPQVPGVPLERQDTDMVVQTALGYRSAAAAKQRTGEIVRTIARAAFGVAVLGYGYSVVNARRRLQESVNNPNSGGLSASQRQELQGKIDRAQRTEEQRRLVSEAAAADLRGETGTVYPGTLGAALSVVL